MIKLLTAELQSVSLHFIGNKTKDEDLVLTDTEVNISDLSLVEILTTYFTTSFYNKEDFYEFKHTSDLNLNEIYSYVSEIFARKTNFHTNTEKIAKYLYEKTLHPKIKSGELYIAYFKNCVIKGDVVDAVGIFKSENKETFLKINQLNGEYILDYEVSGININKLDKGCIVFNLNKESGYKVCIIDNANKNIEAQYWKDDFLNVVPCSDGFHNTKNYMSLCKGFVAQSKGSENELDRTDKIEILNKSLSFFKNNTHFDIDNFASQVFQNEEMQNSFIEYRNEIINKKKIQVSDEFDISSTAVKNQSKSFKSVLKLDKNFHIYIHGDKNLIEKGVDERTGKKFYKIYYDHED